MRIQTPCHDITAHADEDGVDGLEENVTITTVINADDTKEARGLIAYNFPVGVQTRTVTRAGLNYSNVQRVVRFPPGGRWPRKVAAA